MELPVNIEIHYGSYKNRAITYDSDTKSFNIPTQNKKFLGEEVSIDDIEFIGIATQDNVKHINETFKLDDIKISGSSNIGAVFGLVGIIADRKIKGADITFIISFNNGIKLIGTTQEKYYKRIIRDYEKETVD